MLTTSNVRKLPGGRRAAAIGHRDGNGREAGLVFHVEMNTVRSGDADEPMGSDFEAAYAGVVPELLLCRVCLAVAAVRERLPAGVEVKVVAVRALHFKEFIAKPKNKCAWLW